MLQPKTITVTTQDGEEREYVIHKFDALSGREIVTQYPVSAMPKLGDYKANETVMLKLMEFVGVPLDNGSVQLLKTRALVQNHVPDWETLARLEMAVLEYNVSFFGKGKTSGFSSLIQEKLPALVSQILTALSEQSSTAEKQPSTS